ncbi:uncharacterized protein ACNS7B_000260 [Menidia menidia]
MSRQKTIGSTSTLSPRTMQDSDPVDILVSDIIKQSADNICELLESIEKWKMQEKLHSVGETEPPEEYRAELKLNRHLERFFKLRQAFAEHRPHVIPETEPEPEPEPGPKPGPEPEPVEPQAKPKKSMYNKLFKKDKKKEQEVDDKVPAACSPPDSDTVGSVAAVVPKKSNPPEEDDRELEPTKQEKRLPQVPLQEDKDTKDHILAPPELDNKTEKADLPPEEVKDLTKPEEDDSSDSCQIPKESEIMEETSPKQSSTFKRIYDKVKSKLKRTFKSKKDEDEEQEEMDDEPDEDEATGACPPDTVSVGSEDLGQNVEDEAALVHNKSNLQEEADTVEPEEDKTPVETVTKGFLPDLKHSKLEERLSPVPFQEDEETEDHSLVPLELEEKKNKADLPPEESKDMTGSTKPEEDEIDTMETSDLPQESEILEEASPEETSALKKIYKRVKSGFKRTFRSKKDEDEEQEEMDDEPDEDEATGACPPDTVSVGSENLGQNEEEEAAVETENKDSILDLEPSKREEGLSPVHIQEDEEKADYSLVPLELEDKTDKADLPPEEINNMTGSTKPEEEDTADGVQPPPEPETMEETSPEPTSALKKIYKRVKSGFKRRFQPKNEDEEQEEMEDEDEATGPCPPDTVSVGSEDLGQNEEDEAAMVHKKSNLQEEDDTVEPEDNTALETENKDSILDSEPPKLEEGPSPIHIQEDEDTEDHSLVPLELEDKNNKADLPPEEINNMTGSTKPEEDETADGVQPPLESENMEETSPEPTSALKKIYKRVKSGFKRRFQPKNEDGEQEEMDDEQDEDEATGPCPPDTVSVGSEDLGQNEEDKTGLETENKDLEPSKLEEGLSQVPFQEDEDREDHSLVPLELEDKMNKADLPPEESKHVTFDLRPTYAIESVELPESEIMEETSPEPTSALKRVYKRVKSGFKRGVYSKKDEDEEQEEMDDEPDEDEATGACFPDTVFVGSEDLGQNEEDKTGLETGNQDLIPDLQPTNLEEGLSPVLIQEDEDTKDHSFVPLELEDKNNKADLPQQESKHVTFDLRPTYIMTSEENERDSQETADGVQPPRDSEIMEGPSSKQSSGLKRIYKRVKFGFKQNVHSKKNKNEEQEEMDAEPNEDEATGACLPDTVSVGSQNEEEEAAVETENKDFLPVLEFTTLEERFSLVHFQEDEETEDHSLVPLEDNTDKADLLPEESKDMTGSTKPEEDEIDTMETSEGIQIPQESETMEETSPEQTSAFKRIYKKVKSGFKRRFQTKNEDGEQDEMDDEDEATDACPPDTVSVGSEDLGQNEEDKTGKLQP